VKDQQPVPAAGDSGAGNQVRVVARRVGAALAGRLKGDRPAGRFTPEITIALVGWVWARRAWPARGRDVGLEVIGSRARRFAA
jgi:hypothetical protein